MVTRRGRSGRNAKRPRRSECSGGGVAEEEIGGDVLSHRDSPAVPCAQRGLTSEFGMGSGEPPRCSHRSSTWREPGGSRAEDRIREKGGRAPSVFFEIRLR